MRKVKNFNHFGCGILVILLGFSLQMQAQEASSRKASIRLSNLKVEMPPEADELGPQISLMTPTIQNGGYHHTSTDRVDLIGEVKDISGVKFISVNSDVRSVNDAGIFSASLNLEPGENEVRFLAADDNNNMAEFTMTVIYNPPRMSLSDRINKESTYYGLIIGIDDYEDYNIDDLSDPIKDAEKLYSTLTNHYTFKEENMQLLKNPKRYEIVDALDKLAAKVSPDDNVLIFYAGHGYWDERANVGYWLPSDAYENSKANWFRNSTLVDYLKTIESRHTLLIADACFSGSIFQTRAGFAKPVKAYEILYEQNSRKAMTSGTLTEVPDRSYFARSLVKELEENDEKYISSEQLFSSFKMAVINNSDAVPRFGEIRNVGDEGGDFIFLKK